MRSAGRVAHCHHIPIRDDVLDLETGVGERGHKLIQYVLGSGDPTLMVGDGCMVEIVGRHNFVNDVVVVTVPALFYHPTHYGFVLFGHEISPSRRSPL